MICTKHNIPMHVVPEKKRRVQPLHRCPRCTEAFRAAWFKALRFNQRSVLSRSKR